MGRELLQRAQLRPFQASRFSGTSPATSLPCIRGRPVTSPDRAGSRAHCQLWKHPRAGRSRRNRRRQSDDRISSDPFALCLPARGTNSANPNGPLRGVEGVILAHKGENMIAAENEHPLPGCGHQHIIVERNRFENQDGVNLRIAAPRRDLERNYFR